MRHTWLTILTIVLISSCTSAGNEEAAIKHVLDRQVAEWNKGNIDGYMQGYWNNDSLLFIGRKGPKYGYTTTLENYKKAYPDAATMGKLSFSNLKFKKLSGEYYYVTGGWSLEREDSPGGYFTLLFQKVNGKWVIIADHTS